MESSSGRQPNFAALNRGRHLCSAGRPSGWALAHILVTVVILELSNESILQSGRFIDGWVLGNSLLISEKKNDFSRPTFAVEIIDEVKCISEMYCR